MGVSSRGGGGAAQSCSHFLGLEPFQGHNSNELNQKTLLSGGHRSPGWRAGHLPGSQMDLAPGGQPSARAELPALSGHESGVPGLALDQARMSPYL